MLIARESLLRQYFIIKPLSGEDLRRLVGFPTALSKSRLVIALVILTLASYLLFRVYGLITIAVVSAVTVKALSNYSVIRGGGLLGVLRSRLVSSSKIYTMPSDDDVRAVASAVANYLRNYALIISGNPEFRLWHRARWLGSTRGLWFRRGGARHCRQSAGGVSYSIGLLRMPRSQSSFDSQ